MALCYWTTRQNYGESWDDGTRPMTSLNSKYFRSKFTALRIAILLTRDLATKGHPHCIQVVPARQRSMKSRNNWISSRLDYVQGCQRTALDRIGYDKAYAHKNWRRRSRRPGFRKSLFSPWNSLYGITYTHPRHLLTKHEGQNEN